MIDSRGAKKVGSAVTETPVAEKTRLLRSLGPQLAAVGYTIAVGLLLAAGLIYSQGYAPIPTIQVGIEYAVGDPTQIARTFAWGLPLYVAALGVAIAFRSGMFNIGAEGQMYAGALAAALVGAYVGPVFEPVHLLACTAAAAAAGGLIAGGLGWLRAAWGVDEVLSTLLSNYIVILLCAYLAIGPLRDESRQSGTTQEVADTARFGELMSRTGLTTAVFVVIAIAVAIWWISEHSVLGYRWRMTGESPAFASSVGINVFRARVSSMTVSGALCGAAGSLLVTASQGRFWTEIAYGIGWDAVLIALVGRARPIATVAWVTIYCVMRSAARGIEQASEVPSELSLVLISAIIIAAAARARVFSRFGALRQRLGAWKAN
jgi:simple sugar transport system permease protein